MSFLIDTHALLWYISGNKKLSEKAIAIIENTKNIVFVSKASLWEIAIKISLGKLQITMPFETLELFLKENDLEVLDYNFSHLNILLTLPFHHSDPFDRLIISQAISENLTIITNDRSFQDYQVKLLC
ncbi:MAG: type II toxin-antitoxin system VapC family toxin [Candidatus Aminicenantes bacterium]|nr:type II toxin-antitoxin system VapC family toxin [Candidatus Aminicenantes bacterium]